MPVATEQLPANEQLQSNRTDGGRFALTSVMISRSGSSLLALIALISVGFASGCSQGQAAPTVPPPPTVSVIELAPETVPLVTEWVATLDGFVNAQVRPQVAGYLVKATYREGSLVRKRNSGEPNATSSAIGRLPNNGRLRRASSITTFRRTWRRRPA
jgi:hypothetical protein